MNRKNLLAAAVVAAISVGAIVQGVPSAVAGDSADKAVTETAAQQQSDEDLIKVSDDALTFMRNVRGARLAIFNGTPDVAQTYVDAAESRVAATIKDADKYTLDIKPSDKQPDQQSNKDAEEYVPFNANLAVAETLEPSAETVKHIMRKGETKKAVEALKVGNIDVTVASEFVPLKLAKAHIDDAAKLMNEGKYYEANLALKAVEDAVVIQTFGVDAVPKPKAGSNS